MGKKKPSKSSKLAPVTLPATSAVARLQATDVSSAAGASRGTADEPDLWELLEYNPPPLPAQPAAAARGGDTLIAADVELVGFRVAAAIAALPSVPITYDVGRRTWLLLSDYGYVYEGHTLTAKAGYAFDLSSIPRPVWWLIAPNELSIVAPLFHDLIYEYQGRLPPECVSPYRTYTRRETDDLFYHLMEVEGVARWRRNAAYSAVRAAGGIYWST